MLDAYNAQVAERAAQGIPALPLSKDQTSKLVDLLKNPSRYTHRHDRRFCLTLFGKYSAC